MLELKFVASIAERDIDLLVMEELSVSDEFREWFSSRVFGEPIFQSKIGAPPQPQQGQRYRFRGEKGLKEGYWEKFKTCVIAPSKYLSSSKHSESYDVNVSYEELLAYFQSRSPRDTRFPYKARILLEGIEQNRRGYQPEHNDQMTKFVSDYYAYASGEYAQLGMQEAKPRPAGSTWIMFYPKTFPKGVNLAHQLTAGLVKAFFTGKAESFDALQEKYKSILPDNASIEVAGKSVAISIEVPKVDPLSISFSDQKEKVKQALQNLSILEKLVSANGGI